MKKFLCGSVLFLVLMVVAQTVSATPSLYDWALNIDGNLTYAPSNPPDPPTDGMPVNGSLDSSGLGTLTWSTDIPGSHLFIAFFDYDIDLATNTFANEFGTETGLPAAGQSWEIDEPGWVFGDIYDNVIAGGLDNTNTIPSGSVNDVSFALGWDFLLGPGETALIELTIGLTAPASGFYLSHTDPDSDETINFYGTLTTTSAGAPVPEPGSILLLSTGLAGIAGWQRLRKRRHSLKPHS